MQTMLFDVVISISNLMDLVSPSMTHHQARVAYIAGEIANEMGLPEERIYNLVLSGLLHDCGAITLNEKLDTLRFDYAYSSLERHEHGLKGSKLLKNSILFDEMSHIIKYHHVYWSERNNPIFRAAPLESYILHLADRIDILIKKDREILSQYREIVSQIEFQSGSMFMPELVSAFAKLAQKEYFWLDIISSYLQNALKRHIIQKKTTLDLEGLLDLAKVMYQMIDFRSRFTATHSAGVAACAQELSRYIGFSKDEQKTMFIAGLLHDLGKLSVPTEILEKDGPLTEAEMNIMKGHTYYSSNVLSQIENLSTVNQWASLHHERLDGSGYPFHLTDKQISLGSRVMAVADVFTALSEDRPYRKAMPVSQALDIIKDMTVNRKLDPSVVGILIANTPVIYKKMHKSQLVSISSREEFLDTEVLYA